MVTDNHLWDIQYKHIFYRNEINRNSIQDKSMQFFLEIKLQYISQIKC